jgi:hypothetical protein
MLLWGCVSFSSIVIVIIDECGAGRVVLYAHSTKAAENQMEKFDSSHIYS